MKLIKIFFLCFCICLKINGQSVYNYDYNNNICIYKFDTNLITIKSFEEKMINEILFYKQSDKKFKNDSFFNYMFATIRSPINGKNLYFNIIFCNENDELNFSIKESTIFFELKNICIKNDRIYSTFDILPLINNKYPIIICRIEKIISECGND